MSTADELLTAYQATLRSKAPGTVDGYMRALRQLTAWIAERPGSAGAFRPEFFTRTALETYMTCLEAEGYSPSHRTLVKAAASGFARWLIDQDLLARNPTVGLHIPPQPLLAPRMLSPDQRYVLRNLVERADDPRGAAIFGLGYWAGCRVSDVAWLKVENTHVGPRSGWLTVGYKGGKTRAIDLRNEARRPLFDYLASDERRTSSPFVFTSQRSDRLSEAGVHHWLRTLKRKATKEEWDLVHDVTFHDLRHDFAHRAREAGWTLEELAYYLGHITRRGTPAVQTTVRYTQASRQQIRDKLHLLSG